MEVGVAIAAAVGLGGLWVLATRRHDQRRRARDADWHGTDARTELWVSHARCPHCSAGRGLVSEEGEQAWFECLSCGRRHPRRSRG